MENQHKHNLLDWEIELRQEVQQYEFDFDPDAWNEMEQLLGNLNPISTSTQATVTIATTKLIGIISIGFLLNWLILGLVLYQYKGAESKPSKQPVPIPIEQKRDSINTIIGQKELMTPIIESLNKTPIHPPVNQLINQVDSLTLLEQPIIEKRPSLPSFSLLNTRNIPLLVVPKPLPDTSIMKIKLPKRKRNRKTLFPDVIEH